MLSYLRRCIDSLHRAEDGLLALLLTLMIVLAGTQILMRNLFDSGFVWIDPLLRALVLWVGLVGATVATRHNKHIRIDLLSQYFRRNTVRLIEVVVSQVSAWTCLLVMLPQIRPRWGVRALPPAPGRPTSR